MKDIIIASLKSKRPELSEGSLKTYSSMLSSMIRKLELGNDLKSIKSNKSKIIKYIEGIEKPQSRKTILSSLVILTDDTDYKDMMSSNTKIINENYKEQKVSPDKLKDMKTMDELREIYNILNNRVKKSPTQDNHMELLMSALFTGVVDGLPPRRLLDYVEMKKCNYNKDIDNYVTDKEFVFNNYKTVKKHGKQTIQIPKELQPIISKIIDMGETDYLLHKKDKPYTVSQMSRKLKTMFGVSVDGLRSIYLSNLYKGIPAVAHLEEIADGMGNTIMTALTNYVKTDLQH